MSNEVKRHLFRETLVDDSVVCYDPFKHIFVPFNYSSNGRKAVGRLFDSIQRIKQRPRTKRDLRRNIGLIETRNLPAPRPHAGTSTLCSALRLI